MRGIATRMSEKILTTKYGAMRIGDDSTDRYYIAQWTSEPYTLQEDKNKKCYTPPVIVIAKKYTTAKDYRGLNVLDEKFQNL